MPSRMIKDSIRTSKNVNSLTDFQFRLWIHLITYVDDFGRGSADPELLSSLVFPRRRSVSEKQIQSALKSLESKGMITLYESDGEPFFYFPKFGTHQRIRKKYSNFPEPPTSGSELPSIDSEPLTSDAEMRDEVEHEVEEEVEVEHEVEHTPRVRERRDEKDDVFSAFWAAYPKKNGGDIREAFMEYRHVTEDLGVPPQELEKAALNLANATEPQDIRYLPNAAKWLRNRGWQTPAVKKEAQPEKKRQYTTAAEYNPPKQIDASKLEQLKRDMGGWKRSEENG